MSKPDDFDWVSEMRSDCAELVSKYWKELKPAGLEDVARMIHACVDEFALGMSINLDRMEAAEDADYVEA